MHILKKILKYEGVHKLIYKLHVQFFAKSGMFDLLCVKSMIDSVTRSCLFMVLYTCILYTILNQKLLYCNLRGSA